MHFSLAISCRYAEKHQWKITFMQSLMNLCALHLNNEKREGEKISEKLHFQKYVIVFSVVLLTIVYGTTAMAATTTAKPRKLTPQAIKPVGVQQIQFSRIDHGDVILLPASYRPL